MPSEIWSDRKVLAKALGFELASVGFFLEDDTEKALPGCLSLVVSVRVVGVQIGSTTINPLKDGPFQVAFKEPVGGAAQGRVDDTHAIDSSGASPAAWGNASAVGFRVTAVGDVTIPISAIAGLLPLGPLIKLALAHFGNKVKVTLAHEDVVAHLPRHA